MGYYDGLSLDSDAASSYAVADALDMPVLFLVPCRGTALSIVPLLLGMLAFRENSHIKGILLNRCSGMLYPRLKEMIERELSKHGYAIPVVGYIPEDPLFHLESRHLGLVLPEEIATIRQQLFDGGDAFKDNRRSGTDPFDRRERVGFRVGTKERTCAGLCTGRADPGADRRGKRPCVLLLL